MNRNSRDPYLESKLIQEYEIASYFMHEPINISSDQQFNDQAVDEGWAGNGSKENPYVIESLNITSDSNCIEITDVVSYFEIRNCLLSSPNESEEWEYPYNFDYGIHVENSSHVVIDSCHITYKYGAIRIREAQCAILNNTCIGNRIIGIYVYSADNSTIDSNIIERVSTGISVSSCDNMTLQNNTILSRSRGIQFSCRDSIVIKNRIEDTAMGIYIDYAYNNSFVSNQIRNCSYASMYINGGYHHRMSHNSFLGSGIYLSSWGGSQLWAFDTFLNNSLNGKSIYYNRDLNSLNIFPGDYGQIILYNCTDSLIQGGIIGNTNIAIQIGYSDSTIVRDVAVDNCSQYGISLASSDLMEIEYNIITNCSTGIMLQSSEYCTVLGNTLTNCFDCSIYLGNANNGQYIGNEITGADLATIGFSITNTETSTFQNNILVNAGFKVDGHRLESWSHTMTNNIVNGKPLGYFSGMQNTEIDVSQYSQVILGGCDGVTVKNGYFEFVPVGVELGYSENCIVRNVTVLNCSWHGIHTRNTYTSHITNTTVRNSKNDGMYLYFTFDTNVTSNVVTHNERNGIRLFSSHRCKVFENSIGWNGLANGYDSNTANMWDDGISIGNRWSDYNGSGYYPIAGNEGVFDHFPSIYQFESGGNVTTTQTTLTNSTTTQNDYLQVNLFVVVGVIGIGIEVVVVIWIVFRKSKSSTD